jgi:hypothetical protein
MLRVPVGICNLKNHGGEAISVRYPIRLATPSITYLLTIHVLEREDAITSESWIGSGARFMPQMPAMAATSPKAAANIVTIRSNATSWFRL